MKTAEEILAEKGLSGFDMSNDGVWRMVQDAINQARLEALNEACNVVKTYKVGNSGSWHDAAVDRTPIINLIKELK